MTLTWSVVPETSANLNASQLLATVRADARVVVPLWSAVTNMLVTLFLIVFAPGCQMKVKGVPCVDAVPLATKFTSAALETT